MYIIAFIIIFYYRKKSSSKNSIPSDVQAENFYFQVKFINFYLREIISFTKKIDIRDWGQSSCMVVRGIKVRHPNKIIFHQTYSSSALRKPDRVKQKIIKKVSRYYEKYSRYTRNFLVITRNILVITSNFLDIDIREIFSLLRESFHDDGWVSE